MNEILCCFQCSQALVTLLGINIAFSNKPGGKTSIWFHFQSFIFEVKLFKSVSLGTEEAGEDEALPSATAWRPPASLLPGQWPVISFEICSTKKAPLWSFLGCSQDGGDCHAEPEGRAVARERQPSARHVEHVSTGMHVHEHVQSHSYMHTCVYTCRHMFVHSCMCIHICVHVCGHVWTHKCWHIHAHVVISRMDSGVGYWILRAWTPFILTFKLSLTVLRNFTEKKMALS